jgi:hypothetical protein
MIGDILNILPTFVGEISSITNEVVPFWLLVDRVENDIAQVWQWLLKNDDGVRLASSILFGFGSLVLSLIAINFAYRNNFGWKPLILLISYRKASQLGKHVLRCRFEIWNRRRHPVVVKEIQVSFGKTLLESEDGFMPDNWSPTARGNLGLRFPNGATLGPIRKSLILQNGMRTRERQMWAVRFPLRFGPRYMIQRATATMSFMRLRDVDGGGRNF